MILKIALAGNPNSGKTTLFNALTGSNQYVGNWPGVTVEKKEGKIKDYENVSLVDLPGIYSLSPYTLEEVVARNYLIEENPEAILNIIDGTNLERNLYLTTQLIELDIPVVLAVNMLDILEKRGDEINIQKLSQELGYPIVEISALKGKGVSEAAQIAVEQAKTKVHKNKYIQFNNKIEKILKEIETNLPPDIPESLKRWYSIKIFERDEKVLEELDLNQINFNYLNQLITKLEKEYDDDSESLIIDGRYNYITDLLKNNHKRKNEGKLTTSDRIDKIVTNRILGLPIFAMIMFLVYFISVTTVGGWATDFVNDGVFGDGFFLFGNGRNQYELALENYNLAQEQINSFEFTADELGENPETATNLTAETEIYDDEGNPDGILITNYQDYQSALKVTEPEAAEFGIFIPGIPILISQWLTAVNCANWLQGLILDGIVAGVGAVLGFVPQMFVLFFLLAFLESCGYMARVAFIMDRAFRKFGLSGKSFIPMLIGTGCGVPGIMASRTIENESDRRMTIITTTFIPCSAKLPIIALISGALFGGVWWVAPSAYLLGAFSIVISGIMLKKTFMFSGEAAPFVMELPSYHWPQLSGLLRTTWERGWSFIKKAGTVILLATTIIWFLSSFGFENGKFGMVDMSESMLAVLGSAISFIFAPLGWGHWQGTVATLTGLVAKENVVGTFGVLFGGFHEVAENGWQIWTNLQAIFSPVAAFSFLAFNLLCAPCFAAIGAIKREMNNTKWTLFAVGYQCLFAYAISLMIYQFGAWFYDEGSIAGTIFALMVLAFIIYMLFRPYKDPNVIKYSVKAKAH